MDGAKDGGGEEGEGEMRHGKEVEEERSKCEMKSRVVEGKRMRDR